MSGGRNIQLPPLSLYIHIPWCNRKCPYCDFNVHIEPAAIPETQYLHTLIADLTSQLSFTASRPLHSIFIGGGTPNLLSTYFYTVLINKIRNLIPFSTDIEITIEANPGARKKSQFQGFTDAGINRLSLGIQSFNDHTLKLLGREHNVRDNHLTIAAARSAGFNNINLDIIYGAPQQTKLLILKDLTEALYYQPEHISHYQLNIEPNSIFYSRYPEGIASQDIIAEATEISAALLENKGEYQHYEISAFAKTKKQSRHNLNYWQFGDYLGIGAGAHSKITLIKEQEIRRYQKTRKPKDYLTPNGYQPVQVRKLNKQDMIVEFMLNTMRLKKGIPLRLFNQYTGLSSKQLIAKSNKPLSQKLISINNDIIKPTDLGMHYYNDILLHYLD